jgi:hypothetical protein
MRSPKPPQEGEAVKGQIQVQDNKVVPRSLQRMHKTSTVRHSFNLEALLEQPRRAGERLLPGRNDSHSAETFREIRILRNPCREDYGFVMGLRSDAAAI